MESPVGALAHDFYMNRILNAIGCYAREHNLTPEHVESIFNSGLAAATALDGLKIAPLLEPIAS
jgi:hypothetical protein